MKRKALIGLGASGSMIVEDIVPYVSDMEFYCVNSSRINTYGIKNISEKNRFCFGRETGFARLFEKAWNYLEKDDFVGFELMEWIEKIVENHEEIVFVTYCTSGTGMGSLLYILKNLKEKIVKKNALSKNIKIGSIILRHKYTKGFVEGEVIVDGWLYLNEYAHLGTTVFIKCNLDMIESLKDKLPELNIEKRLNCSRLVVLDVLHHKKLHQLDFVEKCRWEYLTEIIAYVRLLEEGDTYDFTWGYDRF